VLADGANDSRENFDFLAREGIEAKWPDAVVSSLAGPPVRGWMKLSMLMQDGDAVKMHYGKAVGGVTVDGKD